MLNAQKKYVFEFIRINNVQPFKGRMEHEEA